MKLGSTSTGLQICINAPALFSDSEFKAWMNDRRTTVCSWHTKGEDFGEYSDTVVFVDPCLNGEGSDSDMPAHCWAAIMAAVRASPAARDLPSCSPHIAVRLTNLVE